MKNNKNKIIIIIVAVLLIAVVLYFLFFKKPKAQNTDTSIITPPILPPINTTPTTNDNFPLIKGSKGSNVIYLQRALNKINPTYKIDDDGDFGNITYMFLLTTVGTSFYPVTADKFTQILSRANNI